MFYGWAQAFSEYAVENITCPVIAFKGSEDDLLGGQEDEFFDMLSSETQEKSVLIEYIADSGGALHCQVGSPYALASRMFAALNPIFQVQEPQLNAPSLKCCRSSTLQEQGKFFRSCLDVMGVIISVSCLYQQNKLQGHFIQDFRLVKDEIGGLGCRCLVPVLWRARATLDMLPLPDQRCCSKVVTD